MIEVKMEPIINYCSILLSILQIQRNSWNDKEDWLEDWRKQISNPVIQFSEFENANEYTMTTAIMTTEELSEKCKMAKKVVTVMKW